MFVEALGYTASNPEGEDGVKSQGSVAQSGLSKNNSTQAGKDLIRLSSHDGRTEERAGVIQLRG
jgi:hypothetical protein